MKVVVRNESFKLAQVFTISRGSRTSAEVITVQLHLNDCVGYGECVPYARYGESLDSVNAQIQSIAGALAEGMNRQELQLALPAGTARNALDCAMWDLEAKQTGTPVWQLAGLEKPEEVISCYTLSLEEPQKMLESALPADNDGALVGVERILPTCADESCHDTASLEILHGKYDYINIKLDKTGGLTEALKLREAAISEGYKIMVGCMVSTSLAMAPAVLIAQGAQVVDLDGPLLLAEDRTPAIKFNGATMSPADPLLWG